MKYNIIGMGNIGLRYLQSILINDKNYEVTCYDISKNFKDRTISFLSENNLPKKKILFSTSLELLEDNTDNKTIVILATTAEKREELILQFAKKNPKLIVSEKLVCTSRESYLHLIQELNEINYHDILVNFFPRNQPFFKELIRELAGVAGFKMCVEIPKLGLACNGIHFIDIFLWLSGSYNYKCKNSFHSDVYKQKRPGFYDFAGLIEIDCNSSYLSLRDNNSHYKFYMFDELLIEGHSKDSKQYKLNHVSQYICGEITSYIEDGKCYLPNIFDAYHSHSVLFDFIEENNLGKFKIT